MKHVLLFALVATSGACSRDITVSYERTGGGHTLEGEVYSACDLANISEFGGVYHVDTITGVYEEVADGEWDAYTYIELKLLESWGGAAKDETVRISGGPMPNGVRKSHFVELEKGTDVGVLLSEAPDSNAGFRYIETQQLFKQKDNIWSNGFIKGTAEELSETFRSVLERGECVNDIVSDRHGHDPSVAPPMVDPQ